MALIIVAGTWLLAVCLDPRMSWFTLMSTAQAVMVLAILATAIVHDALWFAYLIKYLFFRKE